MNRLTAFGGLNNSRKGLSEDQRKGEMTEVKRVRFSPRVPHDLVGPWRKKEALG